MKRCPNCKSRKFREKLQERGKWKCFNCGFEWWNPTYHRTISPKEPRWGGDNGLAMAIDYHNIVYKFSILKDNPSAHLPNQKQMRNWIQEWECEGFVKFQRTPHSIILFLNKRIFRDDVGTVESDVLEMVKYHARKFQERYSILLDIDHPEPVRKEVKLLEGFVSAEQFQGKLVKCVYPDGRIEFIDKEKAVSHTENFIESLALESKAAVILDALAKWNVNFELHYSVLNDMKDTLKLIQQNGNGNHVPKPEGFTIKILRFFGLWLAKVKLKTIPSQLFLKVASKKIGVDKNVAVS